MVDISSIAGREHCAGYFLADGDHLERGEQSSILAMKAPARDIARPRELSALRIDLVRARQHLRRIGPLPIDDRNRGAMRSQFRRIGALYRESRLQRRPKERPSSAKRQSRSTRGAAIERYQEVLPRRQGRGHEKNIAALDLAEARRIEQIYRARRVPRVLHLEHARRRS